MRVRVVVRMTMLVRMTFPLVAMLVFLTQFFEATADVEDFCGGHFHDLLVLDISMLDFLRPLRSVNAMLGTPGYFN
jgi:hypothetical protein